MVARLSDKELASQVKLITEWTDTQLENTLKSLYAFGVKYDTSLLTTPVESHLEGLRSTVAIALGDGGVIRFFPLVPGIGAVGHIHIWDRQWMRRAPILRATAAWAMKKWALNRLSLFVPARHRLPAKLAEAAGFTMEGRMRCAVVYTATGEPMLDDYLIYGLLLSEV